MRRFVFFIISVVLTAVSCTAQKEYNHNYMWFDCEANYSTRSHPDSIRYYMKKCQDLGFDNVVVDVKSILRRALEKKASGVILVHNHPSGSAMPGQADIRQTGLLKKALQTCEIQLLDHVIVAEDSWYSFADEQLVDEKF